MTMPAIAAAVYLALHLVLLPLGALKTKQVLDTGEVDFQGARWMRALIAQQLVLLAFACLVAWICWIPVWPESAPPREAWLHGLGLYAAACVALRLRWLNSPPARRARLAQMLPTTKERRLPWIALSVSAGAGEEVSWRLVLPALLSADWLLNLDPLSAAVLSALVFGLCHAPQGAVNALITAIYGLACSWIVAQSGGSIAVVVVVHTLYDITAGFVMARWISRDGSQAPTAAAR